MDFDCYGATRFACQSCKSGCCHNFGISVSATERDAILNMWFPDMPPVESWFVESGKGDYNPAKNSANSGCIFLDENNLCKIQKGYGYQAKPLSCKVFPLQLNNWADGHISLEYRFVCLAVGARDGKVLREILPTIPRLAEEMKSRRKIIDPIYAHNNPVKLDKIRHVHRAFMAILHDESKSWKLRLYMAARVLDFHSESAIRAAVAMADESFATEVLEFTQKAHNALEKELSDGVVSATSRVQFANVLCGFLRNDDPIEAKKISFKLKRVIALLKIVNFGRGNLRDLNSDAPNISGKMLPWRGEYRPLSVDGEDIFKMFFYGKLDSVHFCGNVTYDYTYEEGLRLLLVSAVVVFALANAFATESGECEIGYSAMYRAVRLVDFTFNRSPVLGLGAAKGWLKYLSKPKNYSGILNECVRR